MEYIDFSRFSPELLKSIETAARMASSFNSSVVMPCHLVGGCATVDGETVCSVLREHGFDPDASMEALASGMAEAPRIEGASGVSFHPEVEDIFARASFEHGTVGIHDAVSAVLGSSSSSLMSLLVKAQSRAADDFPVLERDYQEDDSSTGETIRKFCINMLELAANGKIHHAIGRDEEVSRVLLILARKSKNNPVLVGEAGTGKTAIAEELALRLLKRQVPEELLALKLYSLDFTSVKALPDAVGVMKKILAEAAADPLLVLFIDEIHMLISGSSHSDNDIANLLKPAMARGDIKIFGATTLDEYRRIEKDPAFERRFQKVTVDEPDLDSAEKILCGAKSRFEEFHNIAIPDEVCQAAVRLSARYITNRRLPDKAIDLIDEAAAKLRIDGDGRRVLQVNDVMKVVTAWTGIPVDALDGDEAVRLRNIEPMLHESVVGQDKAVKAVADAIKRSRMGFGDAARPIGSFLFLGTTGTGKTELCKAIAQFLFNDRNRMVRIDMSEYQQEHSVHRLFGAPPGYIGFEQGGQLTEAVYRKPFSVVLFDEIEKAHPKIFESLLQVLDDGRMTDGRGKVVNFKNTIIVMTSNMGQQAILNALCGRQASEEEIEHCTREVMQLLRARVAPEFINRIDSIVMFQPLSRTEIARIAEINLAKEQKNLRDKGIDIHIDPGVVQFVVERGYQPQYGGRPVKRAITDHIINPLTSALVDRKIHKDSPIIISVENNQIIFKNATTGVI